MGGPSRRSHHGGGIVRKLVWCGRRSFNLASELEAVRDGHIRVVVGNAEGSEEALFQLEPNYLKHPLLEKLLKLTGEEYGYSYKGALRIACDVQLFRYILQLLSSGNPAAHYMNLSDLTYQFSNATSSI